MDSTVKQSIYTFSSHFSLIISSKKATVEMSEPLWTGYTSKGLISFFQTNDKQKKITSFNKTPFCMFIYISFEKNKQGLRKQKQVVINNRRLVIHIKQK